MTRRPARVGGGLARRAALLLLPLLAAGLSGCLTRTRKVQAPVQPAIVLDATSDQLVQRVNSDYDGIQSLTATVTFQASVGGAHKGKVTDITSFPGHILIRKPNALRVIGLLPVIHSRAFDLASNGETFKLVIPPRNKAYQGKNSSKNKSSNPLENLRPSVFLDAMLIRSIGADSLVYVTRESRFVVDAKTKKLLEEPDYDLNILHHRQGGNELLAQRVIRFNRVDLHPNEQDIYDSDGNVQTQVLYGPYQSFGGTQFPGTITIKRPLEEYQIVLTITNLKLNQNPPLTDDQFELAIPPGTLVQNLD